MMGRTIDYTVPQSYDGSKLVSFLRGSCGLSSRLVGSLKYTGIFLNDEPARTIDSIHTGDRVRVVMPAEESTVEPIKSELDVIYEDKDILVINKSPVMAMHPTHNHQGDTLANAVAAYLAERGAACTFRTAGRLDKGTSGIVICALNPLAACNLGGKFKKEYLALVSGELEGEGLIDVPIYRPDAGKTLRACSNELGTLPAVTRWRAERRFSGATLVSVRLETGRTHQIRVHFAYLGMPLAGDTMYGGFMPQFGHQLLHCGKCDFIHPVTHEAMSLSCPPPQDFDTAFASLTEI